ncbi:patatin-like phospholipase family protein [Micropruina sp.]|uniref:patatin-like phospholipase family protein n=1 Tax=Micropruina sp. TaxID=2737536 RepID=UPI0039E2A5EC
MNAHPFRVLCIDGGGVRGHLPALLLAEIERRAGRPADELFDLIVGTSTGGIIGIGVAIGIEACELAQFYPRVGRRIFGGSHAGIPQSKRLFGSVADLAERLDRASRHIGASFGGNPAMDGNSKHRPDGLEAVLREVFGDLRLAQVTTPLAITTFDTAAAMPVVLASRDAVADPMFDLTLRDVARATCAAPTFFPPATITWGGAQRSFVDGGMWANNPAAVGLSEALALTGGRASADTICLVSLGTGAAPGSSLLDQNGTWLGAAHDLAGLATSVWAGELLARRALAASRFHRFQVVDARLAGAMDDPSRERLDALGRAAQQLITDRSDDLDAAIAQLTSG